MQLLEMLLKTPWVKVKACLLEAYPDSDSSGYEKHFLNLRYLEPHATSTRLILEKVTEGKTTYVDVSGKDGTRHADTEGFFGYSETEKIRLGDQEIKYGLDFTPWEEWIAMQVDLGSLSQFSEPEIIAHCLWEMTFHGFNQTEIQAKLEDMQRQSQALMNMSPEERAKALIPLEELLEQLKSNTDETL
jgi:hypothetical protein